MMHRLMAGPQQRVKMQPAMGHRTKFSAMTYYRIYRVNQSNQIKAAFDVNCETDGEALELARHLAGPEPEAEIWQATRLVGRVGRSMVEAGHA